MASLTQELQQFSAAAQVMNTPCFSTQGGVVGGFGGWGLEKRKEGGLEGEKESLCFYKFVV